MNMNNKPFWTLLALGTLIFFGPRADAGILYKEQFAYPDGNLTAVSGGNWTAHSAGGSKPIKVASETISVVESPSSGEDVNRLTGATMGPGESWYAAFDVTTTGVAPVSDVYFAHFFETPSTFGGRIWVTAGNSGGDYTFAISDGSAIDLEWGTDLVFGQPHRVVLSYEYDTGAVEFWVDPVDESDTSILLPVGFAGDELIAFAFRQNTGGSTTHVIDNLVVATSFIEALTGIPVPEPSNLLLLSAALATCLRRVGRRS